MFKAERPVKKQKKLIKRHIIPDESICLRVASYLVPITQEEVLLRDISDSPLFPAISAGVSSTIFGSGFGAVEYLMAKRGAFSVKDMLKQSARTGFTWGSQSFIDTYICESIGVWRGKQKLYDPIISGAVAGAIVGSTHGMQGIIDSAIRGAFFNSLHGIIL